MQGASGASSKTTPRAGLPRRVANRADRLLVVPLAEHRGPRDQPGGSRADTPAGRFRTDAAVHLDPRLQAPLLYPAGQLLDLRQTALDEVLAAEAWVHRHHQDQVDRVEHVLEV